MKVRSALAVTVAAAVGTAPFVAFYFGTVPLIGLIASPLVVTLVSNALLISLLALTLPVFGIWLVPVAELLFDCTNWLVSFFILFEGSLRNTPGTISWDVLGWLFFFFVLVGWQSRFFRWTLLVVFLLGSFFRVFQARPAVTVTFLDMGQADAVVIDLPHSPDLVIDTGKSKYDAHTILNHLAAIRSTDISIFLSHGDLDHAGGLPELISSYPSSRLFHAGWLRSRQIELSNETLRGSPIKIGSGARLWSLHPNLPGSSNEFSLILLFQYGRHRILFMGDAESDSENMLVNTYGSWLSADVLKVGHHGSNTSTTPALLDVVHPSFAVISAGLNNRFGHPHSDVLARLENEKVTIHTTHSSQYVQVRLDGMSDQLQLRHN